MSVFGDELLTSPDLFPARLAGEPWGEHGLEIDLPGASTRLSGLCGDQLADLREHFGAFCREPDPAAADARPETRVLWAPAEDFREPPPAVPGEELPEYRLDLDARPRSLRLAGQGFMGRIEWSDDGGLRGAAVWTCREAGPGFCETVENVLRVLSAYRLLEERSVLIHSAALVRDGEALLFPGRSGAGKSTLCGLAAGAGFAVLSDELNVLRVGDGGARVEQVPFAGDFGRAPGRAGTFPLRAVVLLRQAPGDGAEPASEAAAFGALLAAAPYVNRDPYRGPRLEPLVETVVRTVPAWTLSFTRSGRLAGLDAVLSEAVAS